MTKPKHKNEKVRVTLVKYYEQLRQYMTIINTIKQQ